MSESETIYQEDDVFITKERIAEILEGLCEDVDIEYSEDLLSRFLEFLSIDIYDWVKGNWRYFEVREDEYKNSSISDKME